MTFLECLSVLKQVRETWKGDQGLNFFEAETVSMYCVRERRIGTWAHAFRCLREVWGVRGVLLPSWSGRRGWCCASEVLVKWLKNVFLPFLIFFQF